MILKAKPKNINELDVERFADDRPVRYLGYVIVLLVFGCFGAWAYFAPLSSAVVAPGSITVEGYRKTVQHLEGGIVKALHVRDGDTVKKGQVIVELEDTSTRAQLQTLRGQLFSGLAREARLIAERDGKEKVTYPAELLAANNEANVQENMRVQDQSFQVRKLSREGEIAILKEQRQQLLAKIEGIKAQRISRAKLSASLTEELNDFRAMLQEGYVEKQKVAELERRLAEAEGEKGDFAANIATTRTQISEISLKILQIEKNFQREVVEELSKVQTELTELHEKTQWLKDTVERTVIKAPESGMVLGLTVHTISAVIPPGGHLLDIVPQHVDFIVEAQVSPIDIDRVHVDQKTEIRFSAFKSAKTLKINGKVVTVSADRLTDEKNQTSFYLARVTVDKQGLDDLKKNNLILVPGMPAEVMINTGDRTFFEYLMKPMTNIFARSFNED